MGQRAHPRCNCRSRSCSGRNRTPRAISVGAYRAASAEPQPAHQPEPNRVVAEDDRLARIQQEFPIPALPGDGTWSYAFHDGAPWLVHDTHRTVRGQVKSSREFVCTPVVPIARVTDADGLDNGKRFLVWTEDGGRAVTLWGGTRSPGAVGCDQNLPRRLRRSTTTLPMRWAASSTRSEPAIGSGCTGCLAGITSSVRPARWTANPCVPDPDG